MITRWPHDDAERRKSQDRGSRNAVARHNSPDADAASRANWARRHARFPCRSAVGYLPRVRRLPSVFLSLAGALGCALVGSPCSASDEPPGMLKFTWDAPADCLSAERVRMEISRLLHGDTRIRQGGDLDVRVTVKNGDIWSADLSTLHAGQTGRRFIEAPSCQSVADASALIIALMIDPDAVAGVLQGPKENVPPSASQSAGHQSMEILAGPHVQGRIGTLPGADIGLGIGVGLTGRRWRTDLRWTYGLKNQVATLPSGASGRFGIMTGSLSACLNLGQERPAFGPCAVLEPGLVSSSGYGASAGFSKHAAWLAAGSGVYMSSSWGRYLRMLLEVDVLLPLHRPDYVFQDVPGVVFRAPAVGTRALAAIACHFRQ